VLKVKIHSTYRVDEHQVVGDDGQGGLETVNDLLLARNTRRMDVVDTRTDLVGVAVLPEGVEQLHVALRELDRDDIGIEALDGGEDVAKVGVAEVGVGLSGIGHTGGGELESVHSPLQVLVPVRATKRKLRGCDQHQFNPITWKYLHPHE
jgi:hypothetical protein